MESVVVDDDDDDDDDIVDRAGGGDDDVSIREAILPSRLWTRPKVCDMMIQIWIRIKIDK